MLLITTLAAQFHDVIVTIHCDPMVARSIARRVHQALQDTAPLWGLSKIEAEEAVVLVQATPGDLGLPTDDYYLGQLLKEGGAV